MATGARGEHLPATVQRDFKKELGCVMIHLQAMAVIFVLGTRHSLMFVLQHVSVL